jgi:hypothetical protein
MEPRNGLAVCPCAAGPVTRPRSGRCSSGRRRHTQRQPADQLAAIRDAWLAIAHGVAQSGIPTVLLGPFIPGHLQELPARRWIVEIHFIALDCPDELRRARLNARPPGRSRDTEEQVEFGQWLRRDIADRVDTSRGTPAETAAAIAGSTTASPAAGRHRDRRTCQAAVREYYPVRSQRAGR